MKLALIGATETEGKEVAANLKEHVIEVSRSNGVDLATGDALLQKSYITDFLTKKQVKNEGEVRQYYITGNHESIITPAVWDFVQAELAAPATGRRSASRQRLSSGKIRCGQCRAWYRSKTWHAGSKYEKRIWRCDHK